MLLLVSSVHQLSVKQEWSVECQYVSPVLCPDVLEADDDVDELGAAQVESDDDKGGCSFIGIFHLIAL